MSDDHSRSERPSRTAIKNQMTALQKLGETLLRLSETDLKKMPLEPDLLEAIHFARTLKTHEAIRRQLQFIGKLMREIDCEEIESALRKIKMSNEKNSAQFHTVEKWRDKLIAQGDEALGLFIVEYPDVDKQNLRQLIRKCQTDIKNNKNTGAATSLFKTLRSIIIGE